MSKLVWDNFGDRWVETGISKGVLYLLGDNGYQKGVVWNGLTSISENPEGGEPNEIYADNIMYASLNAPELYKANIEAYTYPDEFMQCDGSISLLGGIMINQQGRKRFGLCYRTEIADDGGNFDNNPYKLHIVYNLMAAPSDKSYESMNDSPDAITFSWDIDATPITMIRGKNSNSIVIDSRRMRGDPELIRRLQELESVLYGSEEYDSRLPSPLEVVNIMNGGDMSPAGIRQSLVDEFKKYKIWIWDTFNFTTMTVTEAIMEEVDRRVTDNYSDDSDIEIPGIGYKLISSTPEYCDYELIINDTHTDSEIYHNITSRFRTVTLREITSHDGGYSYICDLHANIFS